MSNTKTAAARKTAKTRSMTEAARLRTEPYDVAAWAESAEADAKASALADAKEPETRF